MTPGHAPGDIVVQRHERPRAACPAGHDGVAPAARELPCARRSAKLAHRFPEIETLRRFRLPLSAALLLAAAGAAGPALADPATCADLWTARNEIYKAQGYCFRTQRAIAAFGNAGCQHDAIEDVPLSANDRRVIADIVRQERALRCPR